MPLITGIKSGSARNTSQGSDSLSEPKHSLYSCRTGALPTGGDAQERGSAPRILPVEKAAMSPRQTPWGGTHRGRELSEAKRNPCCHPGLSPEKGGQPGFLASAVLTTLMGTIKQTERTVWHCPSALPTTPPPRPPPQNGLSLHRSAFGKMLFIPIRAVHKRRQTPLRRGKKTEFEREWVILKKIKIKKSNTGTG